MEASFTLWGVSDDINCNNTLDLLLGQNNWSKITINEVFAPIFSPFSKLLLAFALVAVPALVYYWDGDYFESLQFTLWVPNIWPLKWILEKKIED